MAYKLYFYLNFPELSSPKSSNIKTIDDEKESDNNQNIQGSKKIF